MKVKTRNQWSGILVAIILLALVGAIAWAWYTSVSNKKDEQRNISNYEECAEAGYPIMESYPEQCVTDDGRTFVRDVSEEVRQYEYLSEKGVKVEVTSPENDESPTSPFTVEGRVPGNWSFEASFPIELVDQEGNRLAMAVAQLDGDWMTEELVPFSAVIELTDYSGTATLILHKDNPSGLPENDDTVQVPIVVR